MPQNTKPNLGQHGAGQQEDDGKMSCRPMRSVVGAGERDRGEGEKRRSQRSGAVVGGG